MRKMIFALLFIALLVLSIWSVVKGVETSVFSIDSFSTIIEENNQLDKLIKEASKQKNESYKTALEEQQTALKNLKSSEESYQQLLNLGVDEDGVPLSKIQEYEMEKIWITLGNYAKKEGVDLKIDVTVNNSVSGTYDLNFTVSGRYLQIADFIYDVQRDSTLVFKIENFKLEPSGGTADTSTDTSTTDDSSVQYDETGSTYLAATFVCKDIKLNIVEQETTDESAVTDESTSTSSTGTQSTTQSTTSTSTQSTTQSTN